MLDLINSTSERGKSTQYSTWVGRLKGRAVDVSGHPLRLETVKSEGRSTSHTWRLARATGAPVAEAKSA